MLGSWVLDPKFNLAVEKGPISRHAQSSRQTWTVLPIMDTWSFLEVALSVIREHAFKMSCHNYLFLIIE